MGRIERILTVCCVAVLLSAGAPWPAHAVLPAQGDLPAALQGVGLTDVRVAQTDLTLIVAFAQPRPSAPEDLPALWTEVFDLAADRVPGAPYVQLQIEFASGRIGLVRAVMSDILAYRQGALSPAAFLASLDVSFDGDLVDGVRPPLAGLLERPAAPQPAGPAPAAPPPVTSPWDDPALIGCIEREIAQMVARATIENPDGGPYWVDEWGTWRTKAVVDADQPDDWHTTWEGKRYKRICCGWLAPEGDVLREHCGCPCPGPAPAPLPPAAQPAGSPPAQPPAAAAAGRIGLKPVAPPTPTAPAPEARPGEEPAAPESDYTFYAVYHMVKETRRDLFNLTHGAMSADQGRLVLSGFDLHEPHRLVLLTMNADGTDEVSVPLPKMRQVAEVAIDGDGSRSFFVDRDDSALYVVEAGQARKMVDGDDYPDIRQLNSIRTTADGEYVYFLSGSNFALFRCAVGGTPEKLWEAKDVPFEGGVGRHIMGFDISADAATIPFVLDGFCRPDGYCEWRSELFLRDSSGFRQISDSGGTVSSGAKLAVTPAGDRVVWTEGRAPDLRYMMAATDGGPVEELWQAGFNFGGVVAGAGSFFIADAAANGGRLHAIQPWRHLNLFPSWNVVNIAIAATDNLSLSADGSHAAFRTLYGTLPTSDAFWVAHPEPNRIPGSPLIRHVSVKVDGANLVVEATIERGPKKVALDILEEELLARDLVTLKGAPNDQGQWPDRAAGDGVWSVAGTIKDGSPVFSMGVRVAAQNDVAVTVADSPLMAP